MRTFAVVSCILILVGCSAMPIAKQEVALEAKTICCKDMTTFQYAPLRPGKSAQFELNEKSPVYQFGVRKSYFKAFEINKAPNRVLVTKSYFNGIKIGQYLQPIFQFLDANYEPLIAVTPRLEFKEGNLFRDNNAHMVGGVKIPENAKYFVVYTGKFSTPPDTATTSPSMGIFMAGKTPVVTQNAGTSIPLERAPTGELLLEIYEVPVRQ